MAKYYVNVSNGYGTDDNSTDSGNKVMAPSGSSVTNTLLCTDIGGGNLTVPAGSTVNLIHGAPTGTILIEGRVRRNASETPANNTGELNVDAIGIVSVGNHFSAWPTSSMTWKNTGSYSAELYYEVVKV